VAENGSLRAVILWAEEVFLQRRNKLVSPL
jgi:hypothetical protein